MSKDFANRRFLCEEAPGDTVPATGAPEVEEPVTDLVEETPVEESEFVDIAEEILTDDSDEPAPSATSEEETPSEETPTETVLEEEPPKEKEGEPKKETEEEPPKEIPQEEDTVVAPEEPKAEEQPAPSPEEIAEQYKASRDTAHKTLSEHYKISDEDAERLQTEPEKVLPELAANMYLDVFEAVVKTVQQNIPTMVNQMNEQQRSATAHEDAFYTQWPQLKNADANVLTRLGQNYRALNPKASAEQFINEVGAQALVALRIPLEAQPQNQQPVVQVPHRPAAPSAHAQPTAAPKASDNEFTMISNELLEDDEN